jgi:hypothetical protein
MDRHGRHRARGRERSGFAQRAIPTAAGAAWNKINDFFFLISASRTGVRVRGRVGPWRVRVGCMHGVGKKQFDFSRITPQIAIFGTS